MFSQVYIGHTLTLVSTTSFFKEYDVIVRMTTEEYTNVRFEHIRNVLLRY